MCFYLGGLECPTWHFFISFPGINDRLAICRRLWASYKSLLDSADYTNAADLQQVSISYKATGTWALSFQKQLIRIDLLSGWWGDTLSSNS